MWTDPANDDEFIRWDQGFHEAMPPYDDEEYSNYLDSDEDDRVRAANREDCDQLAEAKAEWDPENPFRMNQNIESGGWGPPGSFVEPADRRVKR